MSGSVVQIGPLTLTLARLKLGPMKRVRAEILTVLGMRNNTDPFPSSEQLDAMVSIIHAAAAQSDPALTRETVAAAADALDFDDGIVALTQATMALVIRSKIAEPAGEAVPGEGVSPATSSTSSGSTASSSLPPDGPSAP